MDKTHLTDDRERNGLKKMRISLKLIAALSATAAILALTVCSVAAARDRDGIYENTLRLHVLANSDKEDDQALK